MKSSNTKLAGLFIATAFSFLLCYGCDSTAQDSTIEYPSVSSSTVSYNLWAPVVEEEVYIPTKEELAADVNSTLLVSGNIISQNALDFVSDNKVTFYDMEFNEFSQVIDISNHVITDDVATFGEKLSIFPYLKRVIMCDCGYTNEDMEYLMETYPDIRFVWRIYMGKWSCRTDAVSFSTLQAKHYTTTMSSEQASQFKYCTDMVCLDIGHNAVCDLSFLQYMPELKIFIIHENFDYKNGGYIRDLSYLKYCPKLEYIELFVSSVSDLSFLQYTPNVKDIYASMTPVSDITYIMELEHLERLYIQSTKISEADYFRLCERFPDANILYYGYESVWDNGWRWHPRYYAMRNCIMNKKIDPLFLDPEED